MPSGRLRPSTVRSSGGPGVVLAAAGAGHVGAAASSAASTTTITATRQPLPRFFPLGSVT